MLDLVAQHAEIEEELLESFAEVMASSRFVLGEAVETFESELAKCCEARHAISCNSGTDALWLALRALGIGPGDAVLCPAYSFFATAATISRLGATPVFCDIDPRSLNLDPVEALRVAEQTPNLRAVLTVDLFGRLSELGPLEHWCKERGIPVVEDAAQAIGAIDQSGRHVGERATLTCFSFYPTKNLGALGDAGAIVTSDKSLRDRLSSLRAHGESAKGVYTELGINSRMDSLQAAALSIKLGHLDRWTRARRQLALRYDALFAEHRAAPSDPLVATGSLPLQTPSTCPSPGRHTYHRYVVRVPSERRASLIASLDAAGIDSEIYYPLGLHQQPALSAYQPEGPLHETERAAKETLALPLYPEMGSDAIDYVAEQTIRALSSEI